MNKAYPVSLVVLVTKKTKLKPEFYSLARKFAEVLFIVAQEDSLQFREKNDLAKLPNHRLVTHKIKDNFAYLRNLAHHEAKEKYLFHLDSDEAVKIKNETEFIRLFQNLNKDIYGVKRKEVFLGKILGHGESIFHDRIVKKELRWKGKVHERIEGKKLSRKKITSFYLLHNQHLSVDKFIQRLNYYSTLRALDLKEKGVKGNLFKVIFYPIAKCFQDLIFRKGLLDGYRGIYQAFLMSYYSLIVQVKLFLFSSSK